MVLKSEERRKEIIARLSILTYYIKDCNKQSLTDANHETENLFCGLLNLILGTSLGNMNRIQKNYPAIDLGDPEEALAVQVTSTNNHKKIQHTLDEFFEKGLDQTYNQLMVLIIGEKLPYRKKFQTKRRFRFDAENDIWDTAKLCDEIMELDDAKQEAVIQYLKEKVVIPETSAPKSEEDFTPEPVSGDRTLRNYLPDTLGEYFVGREEDLGKLEQALERRDNPIFITGLGGIGKTELAIRFCQGQQNTFKVHFARFAGSFKDTVTMSIAGGVENLWLKDANPDYIYQSVMRVLKDCDSNTILIIDNADPADGNFDSLKDETYHELCRMNLRLIITTRANVLGGVEVCPMEMEQLLDIMHKHGQTRDDELIPLIEAVNRHTLTVDLMARTLDESWNEVKPAMLLEALRNSTLPEEDYPEVTTAHNRDQGQLQIYAHLRSLFNVVQMDDDAKTALCCATLLPEGGMEASLFRKHLPAGVQKAAMALDKRGFLRREKGMVSIHPVIRLVARHELKPTDEICREFLENLWCKYDKKQFNHDLYSAMAEVYTTAAEKLENERGGWSGRGRALWHKVGQFSKALDCARRTIEQREATLPADDPDLADAYNDMGLVYEELQDHQGMAEYFGKALEIRQKVLDANHVDLAKSYNNVGVVCETKGDYQTALSYKQKALAIFEKILSEDDLDLATSYAHVGITYSALGDHDRALEYDKKALEIRLKTLSPDHPAIASSYNNVGGTYGELGNYQRALEYKEKALEIRLKTLPADHPDIASSYNNVGCTYGDLGDHGRALEYQEKALVIRQKILSADHPDLARSYNNVGCTYDDLGNHQRALEHKEKALVIRQKTRSADHPDLAISYNTMGYTYGKLGDHRKKMEFYEKALAIRQRVLPADHPDLANSYNNLGHTYADLKNYPLAVEYLEKALAIREVKLPGHPYTKNTRDWLNEYRRRRDRGKWMDQINRARETEGEDQ